MTAPSKPKSRWFCGRCQNTGMMLFVGEAKVTQMRFWAGRDVGYKTVEGAPPTILEHRMEGRPWRCGVCGSDDIRSARMKDWERGEVHVTAGSDDTVGESGEDQEGEDHD